MATSAAQAATGKVIQSWVPPALAEQVKQHADRERRSVSALVRIALEDQLGRSRSPGRRQANDFPPCEPSTRDR